MRGGGRASYLAHERGVHADELDGQGVGDELLLDGHGVLSSTGGERVSRSCRDCDKGGHDGFDAVDEALAFKMKTASDSA